MFSREEQSDALSRDVSRTPVSKIRTTHCSPSWVHRVAQSPGFLPRLCHYPTEGPWTLICKVVSVGADGSQWSSGGVSPCARHARYKARHADRDGGPGSCQRWGTAITEPQNCVFVYWMMQRLGTYAAPKLHLSQTVLLGSYNIR